MSRGQMHHLDLTVQDLERSTPFYDLALPDGTDCSIAIRQARRERGHDRYTAGLHHFAWAAESRQDGDRFHAFLQELGATDPDGLKLEYVYTPAR